MGITKGQILEECSGIKTFIAIFMAFAPYGNYIIYGKWQSFVPITSEISSAWCAENESDRCQSEYITVNL